MEMWHRGYRWSNIAAGPPPLVFFLFFSAPPRLPRGRARALIPTWYFGLDPWGTGWKLLMWLKTRGHFPGPKVIIAKNACPILVPFAQLTSACYSLLLDNFIQPLLEWQHFLYSEQSQSIFSSQRFFDLFKSRDIHWIYARQVFCWAAVDVWCEVWSGFSLLEELKVIILCTHRHIWTIVSQLVINNKYLANLVLNDFRNLNISWLNNHDV